MNGLVMGIRMTKMINRHSVTPRRNDDRDTILDRLSPSLVLNL